MSRPTHICTPAEALVEAQRRAWAFLEGRSAAEQHPIHACFILMLSAMTVALDSATAHGDASLPMLEQVQKQLDALYAAYNAHLAALPPPPAEEEEGDGDGGGRGPDDPPPDAQGPGRAPVPDAFLAAFSS